MNYRQNEPEELTFDKDSLIAKLESNKTRYLETLDTVLKAFELIYEKYTEDHSKWTMAKLKDPNLKDPEPGKPDMPHNRSETYDTYLGYYKESMEENIILQQDEFNQVYMDKWDFVTRHLSIMMSMSDSFSDGDMSGWANADTEMMAGMVGNLNIGVQRYN